MPNRWLAVIAGTMQPEYWLSEIAIWKPETISYSDSVKTFARQKGMIHVSDSSKNETKLSDEEARLLIKTIEEVEKEEVEQQIQAREEAKKKASWSLSCCLNRDFHDRTRQNGLDSSGLTVSLPF